MKQFEEIVNYAWKLIFFLIVSIFFVPSFFFVTYLQKTWTTLLGEVFGLK